MLWSIVAISKFIILSFACSAYCYPGHVIYTSCALLFSATKAFILQLIHLISHAPPPTPATTIPIGNKLFIIILCPVSDDCLKTSTHHYKSLFYLLAMQLAEKTSSEVLLAFTSFTIQAVLTPHMHFSNLWVIAIYLLCNSREATGMYTNTWFFNDWSIAVVTKSILKSWYDHF